MIDKLYEEVGEFVKDWNLKELADINEVVYRLSEIIGSNPEQLEIERQKKAEQNGGFSDNIVLDEA